MARCITLYILHTDSRSPELLPFGFAAGDVRGPTGDDSASSPVTLYAPFTFIGTKYRQIFVRIVWRFYTVHGNCLSC